jgi:hypothetical protein
MKKLAILLLLLILFSANAEASLVSWWKFDEGTSTSSADSSDSNTGTLSGSTIPTWVTGKVGAYALNFNGSTAYVDTGASANLQLSVFTYAAWVKTSSASDQSIISIGTSGGTEFRVNSDLTMYLIKTNLAAIGLSTGKVTSGTWTHVAVTYDSSGNYSFYVNGAAAGSGTSPQTFIWIGNGLIGRQTSGEYFNGSIDDLRVYDTAMSASQVAALYNSYTSSTDKMFQLF